MGKKFNSITGVTLIEILIGIVISTMMMAAMYTSYNVVNSTYSQVTDTAKISQTGRDVIGMIIRDIRMAGYKYFNDNIQTDVTQHIPILITKKDSSNACDKIEIVYGDINYDPSTTPPTQTFERLKITYECKLSTIPDKTVTASATGGALTIGDTKGIKAIYKSKVKWDNALNRWKDPSLDGDVETYLDEILVEYIEDLIFVPIDNEGKVIDPPPSSTTNNNKIFSIKLVDILMSVRSKNDFYKKAKPREKKALFDDTRKINKTDKFLRDTIVVSAHARNLGL
tara:strand:+ start:3341 stop:4189 length:849 start_codon:yes stop_codon:yes gene_type:complete